MAIFDTINVHDVTAISISDTLVEKGPFFTTDVIIHTKSGEFCKIQLFSARDGEQPIAILCDHEPDGPSALSSSEIEKLLDEKSKRINPESLCDYCLEPLADDGHCSRCEADDEAPFWPENAMQNVDENERRENDVRELGPSRMIGASADEQAELDAEVALIPLAHLIPVHSTSRDIVTVASNLRSGFTSWTRVGAAHYIAAIPLCDAHCCALGHAGCALEENGPCSDEVAAYHAIDASE